MQEAFNTSALLKFDEQFRADYQYIAGIDEVGRGPLAGPVVAASVIFPGQTVISGINDSKKLPAKKRAALFSEILKNCTCYGIGIVDNFKIDEINILQASLLAMKKAVENMSIKPGFMLIDGNKSFGSPVNTLAVVKGDSISFSIAAASILAKVTRDRIMKKYSESYPEYKWNTNMGYATAEHIKAIKEIGICKYHRKSFLTRIMERQEDIF